MATHNNPSELVDELDTVFERFAHWIGHRPQVAIGAIVAVLVVAAAIGGAASWRTRTARAADADVSGVYDAYLAAMGATPGARDVPEPANPALGQSTRAEYAQKLLDAAQRHDGSAAAVLGRLEAADLLEQNGDADGAYAARERAAKSAPHGSGAAAIALSRYGVALEAKGNLEAAAEAFGQAGEIDSPGRVLALADGARCWAQAGKRDRALEAYAKAEKLGADAIPAHVKQRLLELRAQGAPESGH